MKDLITSKHKHLLWKDEIGDNFILLRCGEVYRYSNSLLGLYLISKPKALQLKKKGVITDYRETDDKLWVSTTKVENLSRLIDWYGFKKRPHISGNWIGKMESLLGHKIIPFRPELKEAQ